WRSTSARLNCPITRSSERRRESRRNSPSPLLQLRRARNKTEVRHPLAASLRATGRQELRHPSLFGCSGLPSRPLKQLLGGAETKKPHPRDAAFVLQLTVL